MKKYTGPLVERKMPLRVLRAHRLWRNQRSRCNDSNHKYYKYYGEKGIRVEYSSREFIDWYLENASEDTAKLVVGRVDHNSNYSLENIQIETASESTKEMIVRNGIRRPILAMSWDGDHSIGFSSCYSAAKFLGISQNTINKGLQSIKTGRSLQKPKFNYHFYYMEDNNVF